MVGGALALALLGGLAVWSPPGAATRFAAGGPPSATQPFRGSPAASWADGAAGIELPEARAVRGMSESQVADALRRVKEFLVATNLGPSVFRGENPPPALYMIESWDGLRAGYQDWLNRPSDERDPLTLFTRFDPDEARPVGGTVKTRGKMTFEAGDEPGIVRIRAEYAFVYAMADAMPGRDRVARVVMRRDMIFEVYDPEEWDTLPGTLSPVQHRYFVSNIDCGAFDGVVHPWFQGGAADDSGGGVDPYAADLDLADPSEDCGTLSRT